MRVRTGALRAALAAAPLAAVLSAACASSSAAAEAQARTCFEHLAKGQIDHTMECIAPERRPRVAVEVQRRSQQMHGCHERIASVVTRRETEREAEVFIRFQEPCGEPPADANGRPVTGVGVGLQKDGDRLWVVEFQRVME